MLGQDATPEEVATVVDLLENMTLRTPSLQALYEVLVGPSKLQSQIRLLQGVVHPLALDGLNAHLQAELSKVSISDDRRQSNARMAALFDEAPAGNQAREPLPDDNPNFNPNFDPAEPNWSQISPRQSPGFTPGHSAHSTRPNTPSHVSLAD